MTRSLPPDQHLLTRSDLARLQVPAGDVASWLARGWMEPLGALPGVEGDEPVYGVPADDLGRDLAARLAAIGKPDAVLAPTDVRSQLLHAWSQPSATGDDGSTSNPGSDAEVSRHLHGTDLVQVLQEAAAEVEAEVEQVLRLAAEEHGDDPPTPVDDDPRSDDDDPEACFDVDDLTGAVAERTTDRPLPAAPASAQVDPVCPEPATAVPASAETRAGDVTQDPEPRPGLEPPAPAVDAPALEAPGGLAARTAHPGTAAVEGPAACDGLPEAMLVQLTTALDDVRAQLARQAAVLHGLAHARPAAATPVATAVTPPGGLLALMALTTGSMLWSVLLWWKADAPRLALATALGANAVAWWLLARRPRP